MTKTRSTPHTTATERVYRAIRRNILEGVYDGEQFLREEGLAREFQISRTPIREALRRLVSEGWLEQIPHRGARVVEWTRDDADEVFELRSILESHAVRRAATRMQPSEIARLRHLVDAMESLSSAQQSESREDIATLNDQFHQTILESAGSPRLQRLVNAIVQAPMTTRSFHRYNASEMARSMTQHREILQAIEAGDPVWAAAVMRSHILAARPAHHRSDAPLAESSHH
ncbi:GntR family transcriptional regulator [Spiribacter pallidus]|uniref:GntR family transcriptional regulator n=1 Tax=Spiribacter pallidus TaxID=1987936 RepID=A0ABV3TBV6_9GAMM